MAPAFTLTELQAIIAYQNGIIRNKLAGVSAATNHAIIDAATDCMIALEGEEPESADPFGDLADLLESGCHSTLSHLHTLELAKLAKGHRAYVRGVVA